MNTKMKTQLAAMAAMFYMAPGCDSPETNKDSNLEFRAELGANFCKSHKGKTYAIKPASGENAYIANNGKIRVLPNGIEPDAHDFGWTVECSGSKATLRSALDTSKGLKANGLGKSVSVSSGSGDSSKWVIGKFLGPAWNVRSALSDAGRLTVPRTSGLDGASLTTDCKTKDVITDFTFREVVVDTDGGESGGDSCEPHEEYWESCREEVVTCSENGSCTCDLGDTCLQGVCKTCKGAMKSVVESVADEMKALDLGCGAASVAFGTACDAATGGAGTFECIFAAGVFDKECNKYATPEEIKKHAGDIAKVMCKPVCWLGD